MITKNKYYIGMFKPFLSLSQYSKALSPIEETEDGIKIEQMEVFLKAYLSIELNLEF